MSNNMAVVSFILCLKLDVGKQIYICLLSIYHMSCLAAFQVLSELFSSVFENEEMPTPLHPLQGGPATRLIKPPALLTSLRPLTQKPGCSSQVGSHTGTHSPSFFRPLLKNSPVVCLFYGRLVSLLNKAGYQLNNENVSFHDYILHSNSTRLLLPYIFF